MFKNFVTVSFSIMLASLHLFAQKADLIYDYPLDTHVHYLSPVFKLGSSDHQLFFKQSKFEKAFLISSAYGVRGDLTQASDLSLVRQINNETAQIAAASDSRFLGLCGYAMTWKRGLPELVECLAQPHMIGVKIHTADTMTAISDGTHYAELEEVFKTIENFKPVVLWHVLSPPAINKDDFLNKEIPLLLKLITKHPRIQFVMAHSLYSAEGVSRLAELGGRLNSNNLYLEISTLYGGEGDLRPEYVSAWRQLGMSKILFGTDLGLEGDGVQQSFAKRVENSVLLSDKEKNLILRINAFNLLEKITKKLGP